MASYNLEDFVLEVDARMLELANIKDLDAPTKKRLIKNAVETIYSRHRPLTRTNSISGDGTFSYTVNSTNLPGYVIDFSYLDKIDYPSDATSAEPNIIDDDSWVILPSGTDEVVRFLLSVPTSAETIVFYYTYPHPTSFSQKQRGGGRLHPSYFL